MSAAFFVIAAVFSLFCVRFAEAAIATGNTDKDGEWTYAVAGSSKIIVGSDVYGIFLWKDGSTVTIDLTTRTSRASKSMIKEFRKAIKMWNKCMKGRVTVREVKGGADYFAEYSEVCSNNPSWVASATLPHGYDGKGDGYICVTPRLDERTPALKRITLLHEIGHMMGLRHTHDYRENGSYETEPGRYLYYKYNKNSIMSYNSYAPNRKLTKGDCDGTRKLYEEARNAKCLNVKDQQGNKVCRPFITISP